MTRRRRGSASTPTACSRTRSACRSRRSRRCAAAASSDLFLPSCRWFTETHVTCLVQPPAVHLDPGGELLALYRHPHRIALLLRAVFGIDDLRGRRIAVHED